MTAILNIRNFSKNDERYTPRYAVLPILKYLPKGKIIWCPFDTANSEFVLALHESGFEVKYSHIHTGQDFFKYEPPVWDIIVSNPPFSSKTQIFERCLNFDKPFALLTSNLWFNYSALYRLFKDRELQTLMFDKRIQFDGMNGVPFPSSYFCRNLLPGQIIFEELSVVEGERSRMYVDLQHGTDTHPKN
jgi:hypothetical protein